MPVGSTSVIERVRARVARAASAVSGVARTLVFLFKVFPMLPSRWLNPLTPRPVVDRVTYATSHGPVEGDLYRPASPGPHPGILVCLGVVPFGVDHPQVPRLGEALARSGFAALLYWSPAMRDFRLDPADIDDIASAYDTLLARPAIDATRSGLLGTCVGGAFALMAAGNPRINRRVTFVAAYAAYASMATLVRDISSASRVVDGQREPWEVDPLTRKVFLHTITAHLDPAEAQALREAFATRGRIEESLGVSDAARTIVPLLGALDVAAAEDAVAHLPEDLQAQLASMSPATHVANLSAPLIVLMHDRQDPVVPVGESRALHRALAGRGALYTEFTVFRHLDPTKGRPAPLPLARELARFAVAIYPLFRHATAGATPPQPPA